MDELLRCLRDGCIGSRSPPLVLLQDSVSSFGGPAVVEKAAVDFCNAVKQRRAQAQKVLCMCLSDSSIGYLDSCKGILGAELHALRTETHGNRALEELAEAIPGQGSAQPSGCSADSTADAPSTSGRAADSNAARQPSVAVIVDSLTSLLFLHPEHKVLELLDRLVQSQSVSCVLAILHSDLHEAQTVQALERMSACVAELMPPLEAGSASDVFLETRIKQRTGRVKVVRNCYQLLLNGSLQEVKPEAAAKSATGKDASLPGGGVEGEDASKEGAALAALAEKMGGGMRLTLTQQEAAARENVVLPWEQRQHGALSQDEFKEAAGNSGLGQIMYERDSDTEPDSDEDPDDDLDF
ncbi:hypothetical protein WJX75_000667 [Coccomyxa subellipsoidea]|uniref:Elongator complex protein 5 n=1 Tax=Coccomyxa subellipsoidea TaxID=248742 RepID=A0ABR2Z229_9CHLO